MNFGQFCSNHCPNILVKEYIDKGHNTTCKAKKDGSDVFVKYTDIVNRIPDLRCEYEVTSIISNHSDLSCPAPVSKIDRGEDGIMLVFEYVDIDKPSEEDWLDKQYCKEIIDSIVNIFNTFHCNESFIKHAFKLDTGCRFVSRYNLFNDDIEKSRSLDNLKSYSDKCQRAYDYIDNKQDKFMLRFNHNDLNLSQLGFNQGVMPILDFEHFGLSDPCYDISRFESSVVDEMILEVHGQVFADEMRQRLHKNLSVELQDSKRYSAYKLLNTLTASIFVANGYCSEYWLEVGSKERCLELKKEQLNSIEF